MNAIKFLFLSLVFGTTMACSLDSIGLNADGGIDAGIDAGTATDASNDAGTATDAANEADTDIGQDTGPDSPETVLRIDTGRHLIVSKVTPTQSDSRDFDLLAAIPAATAITDGSPAILAVSADQMLTQDPYFSDYLARYQPELVFTLHHYQGQVPGANAVTPLTADSTPDLSRLFAQTFWIQSEYAVLVEDGDYPSAVQGAALAALLTAPLIYVSPGNTAEVDALLAELKTASVLVVSDKSFGLTTQTTNLATPSAIASWVDQHKRKVSYLALTNYEDTNSADGPKLSLIAPLCAARRGGLVLPISQRSSAENVVSDLNAYYSDLGYHPEYLAIVGSATSIPLHYADSVMDVIGTDYHYANADDDAFPDIAIGRILANNASEGSLLVSRISTYDLLTEGVWTRQFVETGSWVFAEGSPLVRNYGLQDNEFLVGTNAGNRDRIEAAIIFHYAHSNWVGMGHAFNLNSTSVLAPAVIFSRGCSVLAIDKASDHRYVTKHLNKLGAVAIIGAPRNATAAGTQVHIESLNRMLLGDPIGKAFQHALRSMTVNILDNEGPYAQRERFNMMLLGDPALVIQIPAAPEVVPAYTEVGNGYVDVHIPTDYFTQALNQTLMNEWGWTGDKLHAASVPGVTPRTGWAGGYDAHRHYYTAFFSTDKNTVSVSQSQTLPTPLGMVGSFYVDGHHDGSQTVLWNIRVLDFNQESNTLNNQATQVRYTIGFE